MSSRRFLPLRVGDEVRGDEALVELDASVTSSSVASVEDSSMLITPSSPTFSIASPTSAPMFSSREETVAIWAMLSRPLTGVALP
ncbi:hypothetical protein GCM10020366_04690 [Saccharopolyspora gregorii]|uniref:Uncharacterized protein n=1 Tax=Saccharopolyspora gregorii TaxID=33914 RepID=A0ABP6RGX5_9PSEU